MKVMLDRVDGSTSELTNAPTGVLANRSVASRLLRAAPRFGILLFCFLICRAAFADELSRTYTYKGFDTNGVLLIEGEITLRVDETNQIKGEWKLQVLDRDRLKESGPQDGSGKINGRLRGTDGVFLNLNPDVYENNIFLEGKITKENIFKISGKWGFYGYVGKINEGTFEMLAKKEPESP